MSRKEPIIHVPHPDLDLVLERTAAVAPSLVWMAWTNPEHLKKWFTPHPWQTVDCEIDLRPGGIFRTVMRSPEGQDFPSSGCYLEIVEERKLVWTSALAPGYRPCTPSGDKPCDLLAFTAVITIEPHGTGARYRALVIHPDVESCRKHAAMGFADGWGKAFDQLVASVTGPA